MVKATPVDMALSDIISSKRNTIKKGGAKRPIKKAAGAGIKKRRTSGGVASTSSTPRRQSGAGGVRRSSGVGAAGGRRENNKRMVRINISNLAKTVLSSDLEELFQAFQLRKVSVNFSEDGTPVGTGDLILSKFQADKLIEKFAGVALDGKTMNFAVIETSNYVNRQPEVSRKSPARRTSGATKRPAPSTKSTARKPPPAKSAKKPKREPKVQKTAAELDAELDEYMSRG